MLQTGMMAALAVSAVAGVGMMGNEMTHGAFSEAMGFGHNHMADYGGYHCASHMGPDAADHMRHMHNATFAPHEGCPGGSGMHQMGGMSNG